MGASEKGIEEGIGLIGAVIIGALVLVIVVFVGTVMTSQQNKAQGLLRKADNKHFEPYNGVAITGTVLKDLISDAPFAVTVFTKRGGETNYGPCFDTDDLTAIPSLTWEEDLGYCTTEDVVYTDIKNKNITQTKVKSADEYISDTAQFITCLTIDENDTIVGIVAHQVDAGVLQDMEDYFLGR